MKCIDCGLTTERISAFLSGGEKTTEEISATEKCRVTGLFHRFGKGDEIELKKKIEETSMAQK